MEEIIITGTGSELQGVGLLADGRAVFVPGALLGERVRIEVTRSAQRFCEARLVEVLEASQMRREPDCPAYGRCGGCQARHMRYEEKTLFPYVEALLRGDQTAKYNADIFSKHHGDTTGKFQELKSILIKYLPQDRLANHKLTATLYDIYNNEEWLSNHAEVEDHLFVPAIRLLEKKVETDGISTRISDIIRRAKQEEGCETVSEREKEIIVCLVQGMSNKEIAEQLFISVNTVITHRRNIARKLQIRSVAGLTIYAIANNLIDQSFFAKDE